MNGKELVRKLRADAISSETTVRDGRKAGSGEIISGFGVAGFVFFREHIGSIPWQVPLKHRVAQEK